MFFATKPSAAIFQDGCFKCLWARYLINRLDESLFSGYSDDLINFLEEFIKNKMVDGGHFEKNGRSKSLWARYLMNFRLDCIQI